MPLNTDDPSSCWYWPGFRCPKCKEITGRDGELNYFFHASTGGWACRCGWIESRDGYEQFGEPEHPKSTRRLREKYAARMLRERDAARPQPSPIGNGIVVVDKVLDDVRGRAEMGKEKYGTYLRTSNGRDALLDAYQEAIDLVMYLAQEIMERGNS